MPLLVDGASDAEAAPADDSRPTDLGGDGSKKAAESSVSFHKEEDASGQEAKVTLTTGDGEKKAG